MSLITRFEDVRAWQEARELVKMIYKLTNKRERPGPSSADLNVRSKNKPANKNLTSDIWHQLSHRGLEGCTIRGIKTFQ